MFRIYPYKVGSASVKKLKEELNAKIIKLKNSKYRYRDRHTVINWGNSTLPARLMEADIFNEPDQVGIASNKLKAFEAMDDAGVSVVPYTEDVDTASLWLEEGYKVFARKLLTGHSGQGIEVVEGGKRDEVGMFAIQEAQRILDGANLGDIADALDEDYNLLADNAVAQDLPDAPLYTMGVSNKGEYRVHVMSGEVILYQKKSRKLDEDGEVEVAEGEDVDVRNLESGWVYRTGHLKRLERIEDLALEAIDALGLDFGAVDIINDNNNEVYVLEVNTAPGLINTDSIEAYVEGFKKLIN